ncbi:MAG: cytochrome c3 family protein [Gammaproteobacteria bacterium]
MMRILWQHRHRLAYACGTLIGVLAFIVLLLPANAAWHSSGRMTNGHEDIKCEACHIVTAGSLRQNLQANVQYLLGKRAELVSLGHDPINNDACLRCHRPPQDEHAVFRFFEPRYTKARQEIRPQFCVSCHHEHTGTRVATTIDYCSYCHQNLKIRKDPISINHETLIKERRWRTCLGCHDYHSNHRYKLKTEVSETWSAETLQRYFDGGPSPYGNNKLNKAKRDVDSNT